MANPQTHAREEAIALAVRSVTLAAEFINGDTRETGADYRFKESIRDVVTELDEKIEAEIKNVLKAHKAPMLGEETCGAFGDFKKFNGPFWCVDPIDGTLNFIKGLPFFGTSVALVEKRGDQFDYQVGAIYLHKFRELYFNHHTTGAYLNGRPLNRLNERMEKSLFGVCLSSLTELAEPSIRLAERMNAKTLGFLRLGAASVVLANVVTGKLGGAFGFGVKIWDIAGGMALAQAVGCEIWTAPMANDPYRVSFIVGNSEFVDQVKKEAQSLGLFK